MGTELVDTLEREKRLDAAGYRSLLECRDPDTVAYLHETARRAAVRRFGHGIYVRGLMEFTNICRNDCLYCGIRMSNRNISRYCLTAEEILGRCSFGYRLGFRTFVLQGGELPDEADDFIEKVCSLIHGRFPDCAITLSLGERREESYRRFFNAGATRYLLRHETRNPGHYARLHPADMSLENRLRCMDWLKAIGYQTGTGIMVGSPYQSTDNIIEDIQYIRSLRPEMIGLGPFIPHRDTRFAGWYRETAFQDANGNGDNTDGMTGNAGRNGREDRRMELTLKLISIFRLMLPDALIPATTSLATVANDGREKGILSGANVVMPNLSPPWTRDSYSLYDDKASSGSESAEGLAELESRLARIGYHIDFSRGDYSENCI